MGLKSVAKSTQKCDKYNKSGGGIELTKLTSSV